VLAQPVGWLVGLSLLSQPIWLPQHCQSSEGTPASLGCLACRQSRQPACYGLSTRFALTLPLRFPYTTRADVENAHTVQWFSEKCIGCHGCQLQQSCLPYSCGAAQGVGNHPCCKALLGWPTHSFIAPGSSHATWWPVSWTGAPRLSPPMCVVAQMQCKGVGCGHFACVSSCDQSPLGCWDWRGLVAWENWCTIDWLSWYDGKVGVQLRNFDRQCVWGLLM